jgi:purine-binding chemotaxis protein CheW
MITTTNQYVTFRINQEVYALDVGNAREIVEVPRLTRMPNTPAWIRGVMNLRGSVVPVVDLKQKFAMGSTEITANACVLMVEFNLDDQLIVIGLLVDAVLEVFELREEAIEEPPKFGARYSRRYIRGMGRRNDVVFIILDPEKVFADVDLESGLGSERPSEQRNSLAPKTINQETSAITQGGSDAVA